MGTGPAVKVPGLVFCSGQVGMGEIKAATVESLGNLKTVLELSGSSLEKVVKFNSISFISLLVTLPQLTRCSLSQRHGRDGQ